MSIRVRTRGLLATTLLCGVCFAQAGLWSVSGTPTGLQEVPPNASPAVGAITGVFDDVTNVLNMQVNASGFVANLTAGHIHQAPVGTNGGVIVVLANTAGGTVWASSGNYALTAAQETQGLGGNLYVNLHTNAFPGGEIRGQLRFRPIISGTVDLQDWLPGPAGVPVQVAFVQAGSVVDTVPTTLLAGGDFRVTTSATGVCDVYVKGSHWLRRVSGPVNVSVPVSGLAYSLENGDITNDNNIDSDDFDLLVANFGGGGPIGDLDGSGGVDSDDFDILIKNFGLSGN
ncbi:MAG TPA: CHRD domain-containing protein [Fimbriimonadaceae bacterium]|nr:CHRD domain-containing protein [Fimbriimonadaceae bacterium]